MGSEISVGEAIVELLEAYGVDTVFGIPGVHNVEMYRALPRSGIRHILTRHEQGAGFMADGYARATGKPGTCFTITGPGLTNILTPLGQAWSDSVPMLVISTALDVADQAFGRGRLHEMRNQRGAANCVVEPAVSANSARDVQDAVAAAFAGFAGRRPRPAYLEVPIDVLKSPAGPGWSARPVAGAPHPAGEDVAKAAALLSEATRPVMIVGGGARRLSAPVTAIAERLGAIVFTTIAAKGVLPDRHPLHAGAVLPHASSIALIEQADVVLAVGTDISETDLWDQRMAMTGALIRIDIDPATLARPYPASLPILADAGIALEVIAAALQGSPDGERSRAAAARVTALRDELGADDDGLRAMLRQVLEAIRNGLPEDAIVASDMTQIAYAANEIFPMNRPGLWLHPAGFGTLGYALPAAIGARTGCGQAPVAALIGDYGFQYTVAELGTAAELNQPLAVLLWNNDSLGQIRDDMVRKGIQPNAVTAKNPDFQMLFRAYGCHAEKPANVAEIVPAIGRALAADRPSLIEMTPRMAGL
ncbi:MAG TPA: 5-guanidino-2-oxopentanoate decarboxylase [Aestuariivirgaceae bacterium]|nr:5-guanidino-2-oxopentanoate decarboxylase [Aestuariivirgaceae bacterium]